MDRLIPIFRVKSALEAAKWYGKLGFQVVGQHRFGPSMPLYMFLSRDGAELHLSEHTGDAKGPSLAYLWVDDLAPIASAFDAAVIQQPWAKEIKLQDRDGNRLRIALVGSGIGDMRD